MPKRIGVDETSFQKRHEYVTVVSDHENGNVIYVADDRSKKSLDGFYKGLDMGQRAAIESVAMDMWEAFINSTRKYVPDADHKISFDKFHIAKHLNDGVDRVRREENTHLLGNGFIDLKKSRYLWLMNPENIDEQRWRKFEPLRNSTLKTARAWAIKETAMMLWGYVSRAWAIKAWKKCLNWAMRSRLEPMKQVARTLKKYLWGIINAVVLKVNNAKSEGINFKIQKLKQMACGYRNRERFRNNIYFHLGGLDLYPEGIKRR
jgi:transposase